MDALGTRGEARTSGHHRNRGAMVTGLLLLLLLLTPFAGARADQPEPDQANLLVLHSISLIANNATPTAVVTHLTDALAASNQSGVDRAKVGQALVLAKASVTARDSRGKLAQARQLLTKAIDIRAATGYGEIPKPGQVGRDVAPYATGAGAGTTVILDELQPARGVSDGGDAVLLAAGILMLIVGLYLSRRWRPTDTIHQLRARSIEADRQVSA